MLPSLRCPSRLSIRLLPLLLLLLVLLILLPPLSAQTEPLADPPPADPPSNPPPDSIDQVPLSPPLAPPPPAQPPSPPSILSPAHRPSRPPLQRHPRHRLIPSPSSSNTTDALVPHGTHFHLESENEANSGFILLVMLLVIVVGQAALVLWKRLHVRSFDRMALLGLWLIPFGWSLYGGYWRMLTVWLLYSVVTGWVMRKAVRRQVDRRTPRVVYQYFYACYRLCYGCAMLGYLLLMSEFLGLSLLLPDALTPLAPTGFRLLFYGLYYGVLSRDLCQLCSQALAVNLGYVAAKGEMPSKSLPSNTCAICDHQLHSSVRLTDTTSQADEAVISTQCGHSFHLYCIRGWALVGKNSICPCCHEKVELRALLGPNPWEQTALAWGMVLDALRYMIVFNPLILLLSQGVLYLIY